MKKIQLHGTDTTSQKWPVVFLYPFLGGIYEAEHSEFRHEETMIDWIAIQFPKMLKVFEEVGCL